MKGVEPPGARFVVEHPKQSLANKRLLRISTRKLDFVLKKRGYYKNESNRKK